VIKFALELHLKWVSADYNTKQRIQFLLFPQGLSYCKKTDECRTTRINSVFLYISYFQQIISNKKRGIPELGLDYSSFEHLVHTKGIEDEQLSISFFCHPVLLGSFCGGVQQIGRGAGRGKRRFRPIFHPLQSQWDKPRIHRWKIGLCYTINLAGHGC